MGFLDRLHRVVTGVGGAVQAPIGLVKDLASAPFVDDDDFDGLMNTLYRRTVNRGGQFFGNILGPTEGIGAAVGALPSAVRAPARSVISPVLEAAEDVYGGVSRGIATAITAGSVADAPGGGGVAGLLSPGTWERAGRLREERGLSPGQAFALMFTDDITDEAEVALAVASDRYEITSGITDAVFRVMADPTVVVGKGATVLRTRYLTQPIRGAADINRAAKGQRLARFNAALEGRSAAEIRNQFFPDHRHGAVISSVLAEAGDEATRARALRAMMGDVGVMDELAGERASLAGQIARLQGDRDALVLHGDDTLFADPDRLSTVAAELEELYPQQERLARVDLASKTLGAVPRYSYTGAVRAALTRSNFYMNSTLAAPLRVTFNMRPQQLVNLHDQTGDVQLTRMLRKSKMDLEAQDAIRGEYMAALNPIERQQILIRAEEAAVRSVAEGAGMTVDEIGDILRQAGEARGRAAAVVRSREYSGSGRSIVRFEDVEGWQEMHLPMWVTQEANIMPVVNLDDVIDATKAIGRFRARHPKTDLPAELVAGFMRVWRPSVLLRGAWPIRVVGDEQLRIIAKVGALTQARGLGRAAKENLGDIAARVPKEQRGLRTIKLGEHEVESAFGAPGDARNIYEQMVSSRASFEKMTGLDESQILDKMRSATGEFRSIGPTEVDYGPAWERAVNLQIGQDAMGRRILSGQSVDEVVDWLRADPAGMAYASRNKVRARNLRRWVQTNMDEVDDLLPTPTLRGLALSKKAKADDLARELPDASQRPSVNGEILAQVQGRSVISQTLNTVVEKGFRWFGSKPSDILSRNRFFDHMYRAETERLVNLLAEQRGRGAKFTQADYDDIAHKSREYALGETKDLLYDLAESSELGEMLRQFVPFYSAFVEVTTRWAGLTIENPAFVARMRQVWLAPERAGIVTDENGNRVHEDGTATNPFGQRVKAGADHYLTVALPEWARDIPGLRTAGQVKFNKESFNMALQGAPGFGPVVQIPVNEIVKGRPELEASLEFVLPFGTTQEMRDLLLPATAKRAFTKAAGEEDRQYRNALIRRYMDLVVDHNLGKRPNKPTYAEAKRDTDAFYNLRIAASYFSPAAPSFTSPYQLYIDAYRQLKELDPETADAVFLEKYGEDYFPLTQSLSRSMDGVPPTLEGRAARKKYRDLVEKYPELGGLIIGAEGAGEYARAVYDGQLATKLKPGAPVNQRESWAFETVAGQPNVRLGWIEYRKAMDLIDAERVQRGLPNLQVKAGADLAGLKRQIIEALGQKFPEWYADFGTMDRNAMARRIEGMREIAADRRMSGRDEIRLLGVYLQGRDAMAAELAARKAAGGAATLTAAANQDLAVLWESITGVIVEQNLSFGALYHRWLSNDKIEATE